MIADPEPGDDWQGYARRWKQHFIDTLAPRHLPGGWDNIAVRNLDAVRERE